MWHHCNLAAKESGLECTWVKNDFTVLVIAAVDAVEWTRILCGYHIQNEWVEQGIGIRFYIKLEHSSMETIQMIQKATVIGKRWLAVSSQQCSCSRVTSRVEFFGETSYYPDDSAPLQPRFGALQLLAFLRTKITFEGEEMSDNGWDSGEYSGAAVGQWENCVRSQGAYTEGDWGVFVLCTNTNKNIKLNK